MSAQSPPHPDYILSRTSCSLDDFFCNQFDISHDILHVKRILPSGITRADVSPGYGEIITETQLVHKSFKRIEQDTVKTLLIKNRQRALVHHRALVAHARQVRHCKRADISALHQEPHIMVGRSSRNLQVLIGGVIL